MTNQNHEFAQSGEKAGFQQLKTPDRVGENFPKSPEETKDWNRHLTAMLTGNGSASSDLSLPDLKITGKEKPEELKTGSENLEGFSKPILDQLAKLQKQEQESRGSGNSGSGQSENDRGENKAGKDTHKDDAHAEQTSGADVDEGEFGEAPLLAYQHAAEVDSKNTQLKAQKIKSGLGAGGELELSEGSGTNRTLLDNAPELMAGAMTGDLLASTAALQQGVDRVSINDLTVRKENDGRVLLIAPSGKGSPSDGVAVVKEDGKPLSAMELGQYLRSDGTILLGDRGRALRPDEQFDQKFQITDRSKFESEPESTEISLVSQNKDRDLILAAERDFIPAAERDLIVAAAGDHVPIAQSDQIAGAERAHFADLVEGTKLTSVTPSFAPEQTLTNENFASATESNSESRLREQVSSDLPQTAELSLESKESGHEQPKELGDEERLFITRLGHTLRSVALNATGRVENWRSIAERNGFSIETVNGVPSATLKKGTVLVLPSASEIANFQARASQASEIS